jgi:hypothetical protein
VGRKMKIGDSYCLTLGEFVADINLKVGPRNFQMNLIFWFFFGKWGQLKIYLYDIKEELEKIETFTKGFTFEEFAKDAKTVDAVSGT